MSPPALSPARLRRRRCPWPPHGGLPALHSDVSILLLLQSTAPSPSPSPSPSPPPSLPSVPPYTAEAVPRSRRHGRSLAPEILQDFAVDGGVRRSWRCRIAPARPSSASEPRSGASPFSPCMYVHGGRRFPRSRRDGGFQLHMLSEILYQLSAAAAHQQPTTVGESKTVCVPGEDTNPAAHQCGSGCDGVLRKWLAVVDGMDAPPPSPVPQILEAHRLARPHRLYPSRLLRESPNCCGSRAFWVSSLHSAQVGRGGVIDSYGARAAAASFVLAGARTLLTPS
ncbi:hypothetical protein DFH06DRAFT_1332833 [Mycena polygramma]|nr:hypothetical protein DFH06DRAFT_1332833 [Mycena polygramma]